jgi:hypothetical protein
VYIQYGKEFGKSIFKTMMNAHGSAGLLDNIVNSFLLKVKNRSLKNDRFFKKSLQY